MTTQMGAPERQDDTQRQMQSEDRPRQPRAGQRAETPAAPQPQMGGVVFDDWAAI